MQYAYSNRLTVANILHSSVLADVNVQPIRLVVHGAHAVGLEHAVLFGEVLLCEGLSSLVSIPVPRTACLARTGERVEWAGCRG